LAVFLRAGRKLRPAGARFFLTGHPRRLRVGGKRQTKTNASLMNQELATKTCQPCTGESQALKGEAVAKLGRQLGSGWRVVDEHHLEKEYTFKNFREALAFTNRVGEVAEKEGHHPDIFLAWGKVALKIWTHSVGGLSENDFVLAAKADSVL
jgi:4a-hydroxytetrahydrobiopterin dehydratase